jgi:hypothetical protein
MAERPAWFARVHFLPMRRSILPAILSFLLLFMQQEAQVHALSHLGPQLARSHETALVAPHADAACAECALLAAGTLLAFGQQADPVSAVPAADGPRGTFPSRAAESPAWFRSRAPPVLL